MRFISKTDHKKTDPVKMQVLALGQSRCATSSLQAALESDVIAMGPSLHMAHIAPYADRQKMVLDALIAPEGSGQRRRLLHQLYDGYGACTDFPGWMFVADLMDMYPDAALILNQRKTGRAWADSARQAVAFYGTWPYRVICHWWKTDTLHYAQHQVVTASLNAKFGFEGTIFTPWYYERHNEWVRAEAAKRGRPLLEWQAEDGWEPLCKFLGREVPKDGRPFPHLNDQKTMDTLRRVLIARGLLSWAAVFGLGWAAWRYLPLLF